MRFTASPAFVVSMALFAVVAIAGLIASRKGNALAAGASGASSRDVKATDSGRWVVDPFGRHGLRYFDGSSWTTRVMDSGTESVDEPLFEAPAGETENSGWWPDPYGRFGARSSPTDAGQNTCSRPTARSVTTPPPFRRHHPKAPDLIRSPSVRWGKCDAAPLLDIPLVGGQRSAGG